MAAPNPPVKKPWTLLLREFFACGAEREAAMSFIDLDATNLQDLH
ncbi:MAG: hypothetical protein ACREFR_02345 [Limisphaerales bacterium]